MAERNSSGFGWFVIVFAALFVFVGLASVLTVDDAQQQEVARAETGGAQTLEDILRRQAGEPVDNAFRSTATGDPNLAAPLTGPLGTLGGASDPELWRAARFGSADATTQVRSPAATLLIQDSGMAWLEFREGPLSRWGGLAMLGMVGLLVLFYLGRGRIMVDGGLAGITIERFKPIERLGHWILAGSFILLGITGLVSLFGRKGLIPWIGHEGYSVIATWSKYIHNNVSWAFMLGLIMVFVMWVVHNIPSKHDIRWFKEAGGLFSPDKHPPAKKFNGGQKLIFWGTIVLGASISASGLSLLFPFEMPMFAKTFALINATGVPNLLGFGPLPEVLTPHAEMQLAQAWHAIVSFAMMVMIIAHIYIGSVGMQGAYDAMGTGQVDLQWAKEHHSLWVEEEQAKGTLRTNQPSVTGGQPAE
ncbi:MAG: formate dehydrogenase subunit gamma [Rhodobacteraceae bacterium]|nr:formate dehydrogenase subunit gamma [Paracoccaceae bacterium]